ncbi:hypothetical protein AGDE_16331 [Angomonas deanei]|nr:hypothetical protein AGDE_16331 [Angomonas deanei]|eukprot:EPY17298.1 hypothetical protein AGDE_16331 [Angomonas deanei]
MEQLKAEEEALTTLLLNQTQAAAPLGKVNSNIPSRKTQPPGAREGERDSISIVHTTPFAVCLSENNNLRENENREDKLLSLQERLQHLSQLQQKYQKQSQRAVQQYYSEQNKEYEQRRQKQLKVKPFSFESTAKMRPTSRRRQRQLEEEEATRQQEAAARRFKGSPVPASTFMNKYDVMVEEWCERKAAAYRVAKEKADIAREEAEYLRASAAELRATRELWSRRAQPKKEEPKGKKRAQSARPQVNPDVPLEVKIKVWPALRDHEQIRRERILFNANKMKKESDEYTRKVMPLRSVPPPVDVNTFLAGGGVVPPPPGTGPYGVGGVDPNAPLPPPSSLLGGPLPPPSQYETGPLGIPSPYNYQPPSTSPYPTLPPPPLVDPITGQPMATNTDYNNPYGTTNPLHPLGTAADGTAPPATTEATAPAESPKPEEKKKDEKPPLNKECTFKPNVRPGIPNYDLLWAEHKASLLERKKKKEATKTKPFELTPSERENNKIGRKFVSRAIRGPSPAGPVKRSKSAPQGRKVPPPGTRAHALRTEAVYSRYLREAGPTEEEEEQAARERREREVAKRLKPYLADNHALCEARLAARVKELREAARENERQAKERLREMKEKVARLPPVFAEPNELNELTKVRAEAEENIIQILKDSGLDNATIKEILAARPTGEEKVDSSKKTDGSGSGSNSESGSSDFEKDSSDSSSGSSGSSDDSSSANNSTAEKKDSDSDSDFESDSDSSSD